METKFFSDENINHLLSSLYQQTRFNNDQRTVNKCRSLLTTHMRQSFDRVSQKHPVEMRNPGFLKILNTRCLAECVQQLNEIKRNMEHSANTKQPTHERVGSRVDKSYPQQRQPQRQPQVQEPRFTGDRLSTMAMERNFGPDNSKRPLVLDPRGINTGSLAGKRPTDQITEKIDEFSAYDGNSQYSSFGNDNILDSSMGAPYITKSSGYISASGEQRDGQIEMIAEPTGSNRTEQKPQQIETRYNSGLEGRLNEFVGQRKLLEQHQRPPQVNFSLEPGKVSENVTAFYVNQQQGGQQPQQSQQSQYEDPTLNMSYAQQFIQQNIPQAEQYQQPQYQQQPQQQYQPQYQPTQQQYQQPQQQYQPPIQYQKTNNVWVDSLQLNESQEKKTVKNVELHNDLNKLLQTRELDNILTNQPIDSTAKMDTQPVQQIDTNQPFTLPAFVYEPKKIIKKKSVHHIQKKQVDIMLTCKLKPKNKKYQFVKLIEIQNKSPNNIDQLISCIMSDQLNILTQSEKEFMISILNKLAHKSPIKEIKSSIPKQVFNKQIIYNSNIPICNQHTIIHLSLIDYIINTPLLKFNNEQYLEYKEGDNTKKITINPGEYDSELLCEYLMKEFNNNKFAYNITYSKINGKFIIKKTDGVEFQLICKSGSFTELMGFANRQIPLNGTILTSNISSEFHNLNMIDVYINNELFSTIDLNNKQTYKKKMNIIGDIQLLFKKKLYDVSLGQDYKLIFDVDFTTDTNVDTL